MKICRAGTTALLCVLGSTICEETGAAVAKLAERIRDSQLPGVVELVPSFTSLLVRYDPLQTTGQSLQLKLEHIRHEEHEFTSRGARVVEIPVCYGGSFGPDLSYVAEHAGLLEEEVIRLHSSRIYRIYMLGFLPGFPYLGGLDERLHTPRLAVPRTSIPAGSVGIGGEQTGVYPMDSPGGWQLIGRTPLCLFAPEQPPLYQAGDCIRFVPITEEEYRAKEAEAWPLRLSIRA